MIVGLDGATMELIVPWVEQGKLPNLGRMMREGVWAELRSSIPYITTTAWSSFATGTNPGRHGILDFYQHRPGSFEIYLANSAVRRGKTMWKRVSEQGKRVCIINVPMTYPPEQVNGVLISGMDAPGTASHFTHPEHLYEELKQALGEYTIDVHFEEIVKGAVPRLDDYRAYLDLLCAMVEKRLRATEYLMEKYPWDLLVTVFVETDRIQHLFWKFMDPSHPHYKRGEAEHLGDAILKVYQKCDAALGSLLDRAGENTDVLIMSDHGAGAGERVFYVRPWLLANEYLILKASSASGNGLKRFAAKSIRSLFAVAKAYVPKNLKQRLKKQIIGRDKYISMRLYGGVNWERTRAYSEGVCGNIFINLKGREQHGIVEPGEEYKKLLKEIAEKLLQVKDPKTGKSVVTKVYRKEELYHGPFLDHAPDLTVEGFPEYHCRGDSFAKGASDEEEALFGDAPMSGTHRLNGAFLALGPHFKRGMRLSDAAIVDILPTVLHVLGMEIPGSIDGRVLTDALTEEYLRGNPVKTAEEEAEAGEQPLGDGYSDSEREQIEERLKGLGYLE